MPKVGWKHSKESRKKMSESALKRPKGNHWWTNGEINKFCKECPGEDFHLGKTDTTWTEERKKQMSKRMQGNKHATALWNWWERG